MKKKIALLLSIIMMITAMPIQAFANNANRVYAILKERDYIQSDPSFVLPSREDRTIIDGNTVTDLNIDYTRFGCLTLENHENLKRVELGENFRYLRYKAFCDFVNLEQIDLKNVVSIGQYAFENTAIKEITIPNTLQTDGHITPDVFTNCKYLKKITNNSNFMLQFFVGGVVANIASGNVYTSDLRLAKFNFDLDNRNQTFSIKLEPVDNVGKVTFEIDRTQPVPGNYQVSQDGVLSGTYDPNGDQAPVIKIHMTTPTQDVVAFCFLNFRDMNKKLNVLTDGDDGYTYDLVSGKIGEGAINPYELYKLKFKDDYGPIKRFISKDIDGHLIPFYFYKNFAYVNQHYVDNKDIKILTNVGYNVWDLKDLNNVYNIDKTPFSIVDKLDDTDYKIATYGDQYRYVFTDVYKMNVKKGDFISLKLSDFSNSTPLNTIVLTADENEEMLDNININNNNYMISGEENEFYVKDDSAKYAYILVQHENLNYLGCDYQLDVDLLGTYNEFPQNSTITDEYLDFVANNTSRTDEIAKYSWDNTTNTLTLNDGFFIKNETLVDGAPIIPAINLPDNSTIIVNGNVGISSVFDGILFNSSDSNDLSKIILNNGAKLNVYSNENAIGCLGGSFNIQKDENSTSNPDVNIKTKKKGIYIGVDDFTGITEYESKLNISNIDLNVNANDIGIGACNSSININSSNIEDYAGVYAIYESEIPVVVPNTYKKGINITDSKINATSYSSNILSQNGNVELKNTKSNLYCYRYFSNACLNSKVGDVIIDGGELTAKSNVNGIMAPNGSVNVKNAKLAMMTYSPYGGYGQRIVLAKNGINIDGTYDIIADGIIGEKVNIDDFVYFDDRNGVYCLAALVDEYLEKIDKLVTSPNPIGNANDAIIEGLDVQYTQGQDVSLRVLPTTSDAFVGTLRFKPISWSLEGTDLIGESDKTKLEIDFSTDNLAPGDYTIIVEFVKQFLDSDGVWKDYYDSNDELVMTTKEMYFSILEKQIVNDLPKNNIPSNTEIKSPQTGNELSELNVICVVLILSMSMVAYKLVSKNKKDNI